MTPDLRALLRRVASAPRFTPARPSDVRLLAGLVQAGYAEKVDAGVWQVTQVGKAELAKEQESVK